MTARPKPALPERMHRKMSRGAHDPQNRPAAVSPRAVSVARELYAARRRRHRFLPQDLFGEPTWDILLDLYVAAAEGRRVPTTSACIGAHVPPTTALRWLRIMEARGLVERENDGRDGRRTFVRLTDDGLRALEPCLEATAVAFASVLEAVPARQGRANEDGAPFAEAAE